MRATQRALDDPTIAYVDLVAAIESLTDTFEAPPFPWRNLDGRTRKRIDAALESVVNTAAEGVREAVIEAERAGAKMRFTEFVLHHVKPEFFRAEAADSLRPIRGADLRRAIRLAYDIRSRNVHALAVLPDEAVVIGDGADTVELPQGDLALSLEGLVRLARHVVRGYIDSAPKGDHGEFDWPASLPGKVRVRLASKYWIWQADGFSAASAPRYLTGFLDYVISLQSGEEERARPHRRPA